jgi:hypothetical protein
MYLQKQQGQKSYIVAFIMNLVVFADHGLSPA